MLYLSTCTRLILSSMAATPKIIYTCSHCGANYPKWQGQCSYCKEWNTIQEELPPFTTASKNSPLTHLMGTLAPKKPAPLKSISSQEEERWDMQDGELNRVLGGGLVHCSFTLLGGEPGIGKSTLILQTVLRLPKLRTLYVSGEESEQQLKMRAERLGGAHSECLILCATSLEAILRAAQEVKPDFLILDSIQTVTTSLSESSAGSPSQIRECANLLLQYAKTENVAVMVIGHITKDGAIAGPKVLEHTVDTVLLFDGDKHHLYRMLRATKNRFGSTQEIGIYEMRTEGLIGVENPSEHLISPNAEGLSGRAIAMALEGVRPLIIETQGLVSSAIYANPQRSATGFDLRRLNMLLAVLEKRAGFKLIKQDVFLNIAGGIRLNDPAADLAVLAAVLSSGLDRAIPPSFCIAGEVGLSGEIRAVSRVEHRIAEAVRIGFTDLLIPSSNAKNLSFKKAGVRLHPCSHVEEAFRVLFSSSR